MERDFFNSLHCVLQEEFMDYHDILNSWSKKDYSIAFMPAITWYNGIYNLFDQKAKVYGKNMIWLVPAGQSKFFWYSKLKQIVVDFYENDEIEFDYYDGFPGIEAEVFEESILLQSKDLQKDYEYTIYGANVLLVRLSLSSGRDTLVLILLDHQDNCWKNIIEGYDIPLTWLVDSGRGMEDYYTSDNLYQLMKNTSHPDTLPALYFKGLYNKGEIPIGFKYLYSMLSESGADGDDKWQRFSAVYDTGWKNKI